MKFFNRDISWLSFNERVLNEASRRSVPLMERFRFLSIYSSNLDEFYRVRIPAYSKKKGSEEDRATLDAIRTTIHKHQEIYGDLIRRELIPDMAASGFIFLYNSPIPHELHDQVGNYFLEQVAGYIEVVSLDQQTDFFPVNNFLYKAVLTGKDEAAFSWIINIPSNHLPRFQKFEAGGKIFIMLLDDVVDHCLKLIFRDSEILASCNVKLTRDASLKLIENDNEDAADLIEKELSKRDRGKATRFLYDPSIPPLLIDRLRHSFDLKRSALVAGGRYHNLRDFGSIPLGKPSLEYPVHKPLVRIHEHYTRSLFDIIAEKDLLVHPPYHNYNCVLRFFNEAALDPEVTQIYVTLYRIASDSKIGHALISAAKNGKEVYVIVELKARFDEANNIRWAKTMKAAGIRIVYSENELKVHAKIALIKRSSNKAMVGLLATGNFNEKTARIYTDHVLLTASQPVLAELNTLFNLLIHEKKIRHASLTPFHILLVAQFNLLDHFLVLISQEIAHARAGLSASIIIKVNNLEEESLIEKLYEASNAGVKVQLLVRGICRLVPGVESQSENITVHRIIDRFLEHGRIFIFHNGGDESVYLGSADWMTRNIYHRIEVCFPITDNDLKKEVKDIIALQLNDNVQAVEITDIMDNMPVTNNLTSTRSQESIYQYLLAKATD